MIRPFLGILPSLDDSNFIAPSAEVIGDVTLGHETSIWFHATVRGDVNWIRIGEGCNVQDHCTIHVTNRTAPTEIGNLVSIGHGAVVHGCRIEDNVLIGIGAVVLDHAHVGRDSLIAAKSLVPPRMRVPPRSLVMGIPGRVVRKLNEEEVEGITRNARNYLRYSAMYRGLERPETHPFYDRELP